MPTRTPSRRRTQAERAEASEQALIDAAIGLIADRGYHRTTLAAIGDAAGYSRGLVTERFGSKEGLLWAVLDRLLAAWSEHAAGPRVGGRVGVEGLRATLAAYLETVDRSPDAIRAYYALLREADGPLPAVRERIVGLHREERDGLARMIRAGQRAGTVRADVDPRAEATVFLGVVRGVTMQWLLDPAGVDIVAALTEHGATLERALGARPEGAGA